MIDNENQELDAAWFAAARPAAEVLPASLLKKLGVRGPQKAKPKDRITIRLSHEVVEQFRASGDGWQARVDAALKEWLESHSLV